MSNTVKHKIIFMGTPEFAVPSFLNLLNSKHFEIVGVVTQPDKKSGRNNKIRYSSIKKLAIKNNLKILQPDSLNNNDFYKQLIDLKPDISLVVAYGKIIPKNILNIPKFGSLNIHPSLLPKYRGPSPMQTAILNGDTTTGTSVILMNAKMDKGDILFQKEIKLDTSINIGTLHDKLSKLSANNIEKVMINWINQKIKPRKQNDKLATYTNIIKRLDGLVDWNNDAIKIIKQYRAYHPWPGVFSYIRVNDHIKIIKFLKLEISHIKSNYSAGTIYANNGSLLVASKDKKSIILERVQIEGKKEISGNDFILGYSQLLNKKLFSNGQ